MDSAFTKKEKRRFLLKKYLREHIFDYVLKLVVNAGFVSAIIYLCNGTEYLLGLALSVAYSLVGIVNDIRFFKRYNLDLDLK